MKDLDSLNTSSALFWTNVTEPSDPAKGKGISANYVDVRDVAIAHAAALDSPVAGGERFILNYSYFQWQDQSTSLSPLSQRNVVER